MEQSESESESAGRVPSWLIDIVAEAGPTRAQAIALVVVAAIEQKAHYSIIVSNMYYVRNVQLIALYCTISAANKETTKFQCLGRTSGGLVNVLLYSKLGAFITR